MLCSGSRLLPWSSYAGFRPRRPERRRCYRDSAPFREKLFAGSCRTCLPSIGMRWFCHCDDLSLFRMSHWRCYWRANPLVAGSVAAAPGCSSTRSYAWWSGTESGPGWRLAWAGVRSSSTCGSGKTGWAPSAVCVFQGAEVPVEAAAATSRPPYWLLWHVWKSEGVWSIESTTRITFSFVALGPAGPHGYAWHSHENSINSASSPGVSFVEDICFLILHASRTSTCTIYFVTDRSHICKHQQIPE